VIEGLSDLPVSGYELRAYHGGWPAGFLSDIPADTLVIFVSTVQSNAAPGTICCLKLPSKSVQCRHLRSQGVQAFTLEDEIRLARKAHGRAPKTFLVGIEGALYKGAEMSERVRAGVDEIIRNFARYLKLANDLA
jgi:Ni,Fe-hydrogenase maturation factor